MSCPRCRSERISSAGFYVTKYYGKRYRFKCKDCKKLFIIARHLNLVSLQQEKEIIRLNKRIDPNLSKYDSRKGINRRSKRTFSRRNIARIMKLSPDTIKRVLEDNPMRKK